MRAVTANTRRRPRRWVQPCFHSSSCLLSPEFAGLSLAEASRRLRAGELKPSDLTNACIEQMELSSWLNCFVARCERTARAEAEASDRRQANGALLGPLDGIPYAAKDNFCTLGVPTTAASAALAGFTPPYDSTPTERLRNAGSPLLGKTNMDEFGMGSGTLFSDHGPTLNPWSPGVVDDVRRTGGQQAFVPGGSSGGSAAAVASGACFAALGSDTGGSVRQPAAFCGVVGLKPTYGLIPRHGLIAYASSLDTPGIITRSVLDSAMILDAIAGPDIRDSTCVPIAGTPGSGNENVIGKFTESLLNASGEDGTCSSDGLLEGVTVGIPQEFNVEELDSGVRDAWEKSARVAAHQGAKIVEVSVPSVPQALAAYAVLASAEASSNLARYDGLRYGARAEEPSAGGDGCGPGESHTKMFVDQKGLHEEITRTRTIGFGDEVKRRILCGCFVLCSSAYHDYYELAIEVQKRLRREMWIALSTADVLLAPTTPFPPFPCGAPADPSSLLLNDVLTVPASLAGVPAISIPVAIASSSTLRFGRDTSASGPLLTTSRQERGDGTAHVDAEGRSEPCLLPLGMQIIGRPLGEAAVLRAAHAIESHLDFAAHVPERVRQSR